MNQLPDNLGTELAQVLSQANAIPERPTIRLASSDISYGKYLRLKEQPYLSATDLERDIFWSLFKFDPTLYPENKVGVGRAVNHFLVDWLLQTPAWIMAKGRTTASAFRACIVAQDMADYLLKQELVQAAMQEQEQESTSEQAEDEGGGELQIQYTLTDEESDEDGDPQEGEVPGELDGDEDGEPQDGEGDQGKDGQGKQEQQEQSQPLSPELQEALGQVKEKLEGMAGRMMAAAMGEQAKDDLDEAEEEMRGWGIEPGKGEWQDIRKVMAVMETLRNTKLGEIARLMGRAKGVALDTIKPTTQVPTSISDAGYVKEFEHMFSSEQVRLLPIMPSAMRAEAMAQWCDNGLMGLKRASVGRNSGTLCFYVDGSGSMSGDAEILAKALALGLSEAAMLNEQEWSIKTFGNSSELTQPIDQRSTIAQRLEWATFLFGGGTNFDKSLRDAIRSVEGLEKPESADIVFITDGECNLDEETVRRLGNLKEIYGARLFVLLVNTSSQAGIKKAADWFALVRSGQDIQDAAEKLSKAIWENDPRKLKGMKKQEGRKA
jgi:uncharacterized protein with von Willebrand factor type A (vWA) domain